MRLLVRAKGSAGREAILDYYGLPSSSQLQIDPLPTARLGSDKFFNMSFQLSMLGKLHARRAAAVRQVLFTRDVLCASTVIRMKWRLHLPVIYEVHALNHWTNPIFTNIPATPGRILRLKRREQYVYERADRLVTISSGCRDALLSTFHVSGPVEVIPDGTPHFIHPDSKPDCGSSRLLYIGQFYPWKGVETAVRAMAELPGYALDLYGGNYFSAAQDIQRLREIAQQCGSTSALSFNGFVEPGRLDQVLKESYIGILPAADNLMGRHFISPLKLFEYMGCSVPVVASDLPPIREIIEHEKNGLLFEAGNPIDLARQVQRLAADPGLRQRITRQAFEDAHLYSYEKRAKRILEVALTAFRDDAATSSLHR